MGIIRRHMENTVGTAGSTKAAAEATATWSEAMELLGLTADEVGGDDAYRSLHVAQQVKAFALQLHTSGVNYTQGRPTLGLGGAPAPNGSTPTAAVGSSSDDSNAEPSDAENLGKELLQRFGSVADAMNAIALMTRIDRAGQPFGHVVVKALDGLDSGTEKVVTRGGTVILGSTAAAMARADELQAEFTRLMLAVTNGFHLPGNVPQIAAEAIDEVKKLRDAASADTFLDAVEKASKVKPSKGEAFEDYMTRVVTEINVGAGLDESSYFTLVEQTTHVKPNKGESLEDFIKRACAADDKAVTKLLDEIGKALSIKREGKNNEDYLAELLPATEEAGKAWRNFGLHYDRLKKIAAANNINVPDGETLTDMVIRIARHNRNLLSKIVIPAGL